MSIERTDIFAKLKKLTANQLSIKESDIKGSSTLDELGADSLDRVELVMQIEEKFSVALDDEKIESLCTIDEYVDYIVSLLK